jgi:hypothetical protein
VAEEEVPPVADESGLSEKTGSLCDEAQPFKITLASSRPETKKPRTNNLMGANRCKNRRKINTFV